MFFIIAEQREYVLLYESLDEQNRMIHVPYFIFMMSGHLMFRIIRKNYFSLVKKSPCFMVNLINALWVG